MSDRVILGNPFMCLLYPFITNSAGITTHPFGHPVKFKFLRSPEPREISNLQNVSVSKTLNPLTAKIHRKCNQAQNLVLSYPLLIIQLLNSLTQISPEIHHSIFSIQIFVHYHLMFLTIAFLKIHVKFIMLI